MALIGLISDVHASPVPLKAALSIFADAGVDQVLCAGDVAGYYEQLEPTIQLLLKSHCTTIIGNHDLLHIDHCMDVDSSVAFLKQLPVSYQTSIAGKSLYMVHSQPPDGCHGGIKLLDKKGALMADKVALWTDKLKSFNYDVLVIGHTHQVFAEKIGNVLVVNPGSTVFNNSCALLSLPEMTVEILPLGGKPVEKTWNWGEHVIYRKQFSKR